jgi:hypothetical protein
MYDKNPNKLKGMATFMGGLKDTRKKFALQKNRGH